MVSFNNVTVYLGSSGRCRQIFKDKARETGALIGQSGKTLVYGGMDSGLMGIVASAALDSGAPVIGIIPKSLKDSERIHPNLTETILVQDLWDRKRKMFQRADAILVLPGGFGTIDEALEALYWADLGSHAKPVVFVNTENYWDDFLDYTKNLDGLRREYIIVADTPEDAFTKIQNWTQPIITGDPDNLPHFEEKILEQTNSPLIIDTASVATGYLFATAIGLKQLGRHQRHIGLLNTNGQFDGLMTWVETARREAFITERCPLLFSIDSTPEGLKEKLSVQPDFTIDLHKEKWGPSEIKTHLSLHQETSSK